MQDGATKKTSAAEASSGSTAKLELQLTGEYHSARRSLFFATSLLILLAIASPKPCTMAMPGLGEHIMLPTRFGIGALFLACLYLGAKFFLEHRFAHDRNAEGIAELSGAKLDEVFDRRREQLETLIEQFSDAGRWPDTFYGMLASMADRVPNDIQVLKDAWIENLRSRADELFAKEDIQTARALMSQESGYFEIFESRYSDISARLIAVLDEFNERTAEVKKLAVDFAARLDQASSETRQFQARFRVLSKSIHVAQRFGFRWLDYWVAVGLCVVAGGVTIFRFAHWTSAAAAMCPVS